MRRSEMEIRLVTYNIHKGIGGVDRRYRLGRIVEVLAHCEPDIAFLQEVDEGVPRSRCDCQVERLAEALGLKHFAYQRNVRLKRGHYGNAILSRFPLADIVDVDLTIPLKKRRRAIMAHARISLHRHQRSLLLVNTHLGLAGFERTRQLKRILEAPLLARTRSCTPTVVGGDFNDVWATLGEKILEPAGFQPAGRHIRTFPAVYPLRPLDRLFYRGDLELDHAFASHLRLAKEASDHLPLVAVLRARFAEV